MRLLKRALGLVAMLILLFVAFIGFKFNSLQTADFTGKTTDFRIEEDVNTADISLGERIYSVRSGCIDCHGENLAGAMIMDNGAMGTIYGANITPYKLKDWTDTEIARAIRYGVHKTGRSLRFMPSFDFVSLSKGDTASLIKYIRSVPPVATESHENTYGPVARMLSALGKMPVMFSAFQIDQSVGFSVKPSEGPTAEFGKYLASSCVGCHGHDYKGGPIAGGDPSWPPAPNIRLGAGGVWTEANFNTMLETGRSASTGEELRMPMPINLLKQLNSMEKKALWLYLSSLK